ncbi:glycosyltransferase family 39 protein [Hysterangium stoloniferum]|nr:glycosyltransferase family 39 protein [Hysterangium stoloniferum]
MALHDRTIPHTHSRRGRVATRSISNAGFGRTSQNESSRERESVSLLLESKSSSYIIVLILTAIAFLLRFYKINHPPGVVYVTQALFDEVHFGKFASYYILREYYFDVHPPFAKLMLGLAGWFAGFDGHFTFENIGDSYTEAHVPYVGMRAYPALLGSFTVPLVYAIMKESGYPTMIATFSACIVLFGKINKLTYDKIMHILPRHVSFFLMRNLEFSFDWWFWMIATGVSLAATLGSKMVGLFTFLTIGTAVLVDLWGLLDIKKGYTMDYFWRHLAARTIGLIVIPAIVYLSFFWVHFAILYKTGTGDGFMSPEFQETLIGNPLLLNSQELRYYDTVTIRHRETKMLLHSHPEKYPLKYEDGRISSQGQQVTGYGHDDLNNQWQIIPTTSLPDTGRGRIVRQNDVIQLLHITTQTHLLTHDVASPLMPTNQEFTTWPKDDHSRHNDTLFQIHIFRAKDGDAWKSKSGHFKLTHMPTKVALWTHPKTLPDWAFGQQEINGNKKATDKSATWFVDQIVADDSGVDIANRTGGFEAREPRKINFFKKFFEVQMLMLQHNAGLTASHPYASNPINWPFSISGISFWTENEKQEQVYMIGNVAGWWVCVMGLSIFVGVIGADLLARRRGLDPIPDPVRNRLWNSAGLFWIGWAYHYFPFYLMNRQLFIHHYLPAHLFSALVAGAVLNFILSESVNYPISIPSTFTRMRPRQYTDLGMKAFAVIVVFNLVFIPVFIFLAPLTYGTPGLDGDQVNARRLLPSWTLHFAVSRLQISAT